MARVGGIQATACERARGQPCLIMFRDRDPWHRVDDTGFNKVGYISQSGSVFHLQGPRRFTSSHGGKIEAGPHAYLVLPQQLELTRVDAYFSKNFPDRDLFRLGINALMKPDAKCFDHPVKLPIVDQIDEAERRRRCEQLIGKASCGDLLLTTDLSSPVSRFIAWMTNGPWSHAAICIGEGDLVEATTKGVVQRPLHIYDRPGIRLGLYRSPLKTDDTLEALKLRARRELGKGYDYKAAFRAGWEKFFHVEGRKTGHVPNDLALHPDQQLIALV
jgi:hypothetical protein